MATPDPPEAAPDSHWPGAIGGAVLVWIACSGVFFYIRFTFAFVYANLEAIRAATGW